MTNLVSIGKRLKKLRSDGKLTQAKVAEYLGLDQSMITKLEKGERSISSDVIEKLSALYCCPVDYLLDGDNGQDFCCVSFRSNSLTSDDLKSLARIHKIVLNQMELDKITGGADE